VEFTKIGSIHESLNWKECKDYRSAILSRIDQKVLRSKPVRIAVDMMHGITADVFPEILNDLGIDAITLNAHSTGKILPDILQRLLRSEDDLRRIVTSLELDAGFIIFSSGQRIELISDTGEPYDKIKGLSVVLWLLNLEGKRLGRKMRVFLPTWAPDGIQYEHLEISKGAYHSFKAEELRKYDLLATVDGHLAFTEFQLHRDAIYASLKILELLIRHDVRLSEIGDRLATFYYHSTQVACPQALKGKMMRKFLEDAKGKKSSSTDGVKLWLNETDWILMIPDAYGDFLNLYIQASDDDAGERLYQKYADLIATWMKE
jgi:mannose-1-phosphate guanylyltransferase/phosphomannomutase